MKYASGSPRSRHTILCVDDEPFVLHALRRVLRPERYEFLPASSPIEALAIVATRVVCVVISDEVMPGLYGSRLLEEVRKRSPETACVLFSGRPADPDAGPVERPGLDHFFFKPWEDAELLLKLRAIVARCPLHLDLIEGNSA